MPPISQTSRRRSGGDDNQGDNVRTMEHTAKPTTPAKTGRFATLRGLLGGQGSGAPAYASSPARASRPRVALSPWLRPLLAVELTFALLCVLVTLVVCVFAAGSAQALTNPQRAYEMVSPVFKGGFGVTQIEGVAENGESVVFASPGAFAGSPASEPGQDPGNQPNYLARRGASGWATVPTAAPATLAAAFSHDISPTLESTLVETLPGPNLENASFDGRAVEVFLHDTGLPDTLGTPSVSYVTASSAVLSGEVNPENTATTYEFQYAKACTPGEPCPAIAQAPGMVQTASVQSAVYGATGDTQEITGLQPATTYRYQLVAINEKGQSAVGETGGATLPEGTFTTASSPAPQANSGTASGVGATTALISGSVNPDGLPATY